MRDFLGRRRFLPGSTISSGEFGWVLNNLRYESERQAGNYEIQGGAAEIIKRTMRTLTYEDLPELSLWLQVHDELMGELEEDAWDRVNGIVSAAMTQDTTLTSPIPIETEGVRGATWADLK